MRKVPVHRPVASAAKDSYDDPVDLHENVPVDVNASMDPPLSRREREVLAIIARGRTNREVATQLNLSVHAVKFHLGSIYRKLGVANRTEAVVVFLRDEA